MSKVFLLFPNQLFKNIALLGAYSKVYLVEELLFFKQYKFHKQKLVLHRASMKFYESYLKANNINVEYIDSINQLSDIRKLITYLYKAGAVQIDFYDVCDNWLEKRITCKTTQYQLTTTKYDSLLFINTSTDLKEYFNERKRFYQTDFYIHQRKKLKVLLDEKQHPIGGKWSFDTENRLKYPKQKQVPKISQIAENSFYKQAITYVEQHFSNNYGTTKSTLIYPTNFEECEVWLNNFLSQRFSEFGLYEDAIVADELILHHSVLTPMLNIGLITPLHIIDSAISYGLKNQIPLNNIEGFVRQIIGWREFIRGVYLQKSVAQRIRNFWGFTKPVPASFYNGTTGIKPVDDTIKKILQTGYCHHIERLMVIGNFMLLCEFHPDAVYQWFMELFIDSYDWVMVPNVYGMSQFADGGLMATKPYISGSSYILKMSNYKKATWCEVWDALFWHFMDKHRQFFLSNPRLGMLIKTYDNMSDTKKENMNNTYKQFTLSSVV